MRLAVVAGLGLALMGGGIAQAQTHTLTGADLEDLQCFALFAVIAGESGIGPDALADASTDQATMMAAMTGGMMYHLGRLEGRAPEKDWMEQIAGYARTVQLADLQPVSDRCLQGLSAKGQALVAWGTRVQQE